MSFSISSGTRGSRHPHVAVKLADRVQRTRAAKHDKDQIKNLIPQGGIFPVYDWVNFEDKEPEHVPTKKVVCRQPYVSLRVLKQKIMGSWQFDCPKYPEIVYVPGKDTYYLLDGNHRVNRAILMREPTVLARVVIGHF